MEELGVTLRMKEKEIKIGNSKQRWILEKTKAGHLAQKYT